MLTKSYLYLENMIPCKEVRALAYLAIKTKEKTTLQKRRLFKFFSLQLKEDFTKNNRSHVFC